jgi:radical SAM superfamily enzyme YgiQ (UPF0313 family)
LHHALMKIFDENMEYRKDIMKKKIYFIQPTYRDQAGELLKGKKLYLVGLALPALSATIPDEWQKEFCYEYFDEVNFESDASVIGISSMGYDIFRGIEIATEFRKKGKIVIFGGCQPHISTHYVEEYCDSIIHGNPGLKDMSKILMDAESKTLKKEYFCNININFRFDYSILDTKKILFTPVLLSVGCKHTCDFCSTGAMYKGKYRLRNFNNLMYDLEELNHTTKNIAFVDTNIFNNRKYLIKVCQEMLRRNLKFTWGAQSTIDIGDDVETLKLLKKTGCKILFIGMETISQANLNAVNKDFRVDSYQQRMNNINKVGIRIAGFFMYGLDGDTVETSSLLSKYIIKNRFALPMLNVLVPTPGTKIYDQLKREGRILMNNEQDFLKNNVAYNSSFNLCFYTPKNMTPIQVEDGFFNLLKSLFKYHQIIKRSISRNFPLTLYLLYMNWVSRKEILELKKARALRHLNLKTQALTDIS